MMHRCPGDLLCFIQIWPYDPPMLLQTIDLMLLTLGSATGLVFGVVDADGFDKEVLVHEAIVP